MPDLTFAKEIAPFLTRVNQSINFLESDKTIGTTYFTELESLLSFAIDRVSNQRTDTNRFARSVIISIIEQVTEKRIDHNGHEMRCSVPGRFTDKDKAAIFLNPETTTCKWSMAMKKLEVTTDPFLQKAKELLQDEMSTWPEQAKKWIKATSEKIFPTVTEQRTEEEQHTGQFQADSQLDDIVKDMDEMAYINRPGLGQPKNTKPIEEEFEEYQCVNFDDICNHRKYCENSNIDIKRAPIEFWNRYTSSFPKLAHIGKQLLNSSISSSSLERQFSITSLLLSCRRMSLTAETIKDIVISSTVIKK